MADPEEMQERLDDLGRHIDEAREQAEDDDLLPEDEPEEQEKGQPTEGMGGNPPM